MTNIKFTNALALGLVAALGTAAPALAANPMVGGAAMYETKNIVVATGHRPGVCRRACAVDGGRKLEGGVLRVFGAGVGVVTLREAALAVAVDHRGRVEERRRDGRVLHSCTCDRARRRCARSP